MKEISVWVPIKSKRAGVIGYMEMFKTKSGQTVSIPGVSRWIDGQELDVSKAKAID